MDESQSVESDDQQLIYHQSNKGKSEVNKRYKSKSPKSQRPQTLNYSEKQNLAQLQQRANSQMTAIDKCHEDRNRKSAKDFQMVNSDLTIIKSVRTFKTLKNELYKWNQIVRLVSNGIFIISTFFLLISILQFGFSSPPTFVTLCVISDDHKFLLQPTNENGLFPLSYSICGIQLIEGLIGYAISLIGFSIQRKKDYKLVKTLERVTIFAMIMYNMLIILQFYLCDLYLFRIISYDYNDQEGSTDLGDIKRLPTIILLVIIIINMIGVTVLTYCARKLFSHYHSLLKDFSIFLLNFTETPRSKMATKYMPPMEPLYEESSVCNTTISQIYPHGGSQSKNFRKASNFNSNIFSQTSKMFSPKTGAAVYFELNNNPQQNNLKSSNLSIYYNGQQENYKYNEVNNQKQLTDNNMEESKEIQTSPKTKQNKKEQIINKALTLDKQKLSPPEFKSINNSNKKHNEQTDFHLYSNNLYSNLQNGAYQYSNAGGDDDISDFSGGDAGEYEDSNKQKKIMGTLQSGRNILKSPAKQMQLSPKSHKQLFQ
eukprot:403352910